MRLGAGTVGQIDRRCDALELARAVEERARLGRDRRRQLGRHDEIAGPELGLQLAYARALRSVDGHAGDPATASRSMLPDIVPRPGNLGRRASFLRPSYLL